jgi:hypothetical protein
MAEKNEGTPDIRAHRSSSRPEGLVDAWLTETSAHLGIGQAV